MRGTAMQHAHYRKASALRIRRHLPSSSDVAKDNTEQQDYGNNVVALVATSFELLRDSYANFRPT
jgi:hypothetical protein